MPRRFSKAEVDRFLGGRRVAVLGTNGADGSPVLTPIWYLYTDGHLLMRTDKQSVKAKNIARDPRVTVCVQDERPPYASVTVYGKAAIELAQEKVGVQMAKHYLGAIGAAGYQRAAREAIETGKAAQLLPPEGRLVNAPPPRLGAIAWRRSQSWQDASPGRCATARSCTARLSSLARRQCFASRRCGRHIRSRFPARRLESGSSRCLLRLQQRERGDSLSCRARIHVLARSLRATGQRETVAASTPANRPGDRARFVAPNACPQPGD